MITDCVTKTITEVTDDKVKISCFASVNQDAIDTPTLFRADLLKTPATINKTSGLEGELLLTHTDSGEVARINENGELILDLKDDDVNKYSINENGELIYNG